MPALDHITSCLIVSDADVKASMGCKADSRALIEKMASVARPNQGGARILAVLAKLDGQDWLDGRLRVEIGGDSEVCVLDVLTQLGGGFAERVWPTIAVPVSLDEIRRAVKMQPKFILPLLLKHDRPTRLVLTAASDQRSSSLPPPIIHVGDAAITWGQRPPGSIPTPLVPKIEMAPPRQTPPSAASPRSPTPAPRPAVRAPIPSPADGKDNADFIDDEAVTLRRRDDTPKKG
ncbi:MAG: hypothetical protein HY898_34790 [Deltaproteobacteria bacterium]|nr:hypothetical protein [Deltaproteobacteria bacterium]